MISSTNISSERDTRAIWLWLYAVAALVLAMVLVGGATRLTESGLSITEWKPVMGTLPPLGKAAWQAEFAKYQAIPQYHELNNGMSLNEFKTIYWWEWTHRLLGRLIGVAFLLPFLWFLWRGWVAPGLRVRLWFIFGLGALQGAVGWWMVASGLSDRVEVSQYRLATHLVLACAIYVALLWTAQRLGDRPVPPSYPHPHAGEGKERGRIRAGAIGLLVLVLAQIYSGALVAGLRAGYVYNTWPLVDGRVGAGRVAALFRYAAVAKFFREHAHGAIRSPHARLRDLALRAPARTRRRAHAQDWSGAHRCICAVRRGHFAGGAWHFHGSAARAAFRGAAAPGGGDAGADRGGHARC